MEKLKEIMIQKFKNEYCIHCLENLRVQKDLRKVQCTRNGCRKTYPISTYPLLYNRNLDIGTTLLLIYAILECSTFSQLKSFIIINKNTVSTVKQDIEKILTQDYNERNMQIGGISIVVEIYESKFGKRKYHRGHKVDDV